MSLSQEIRYSDEVASVVRVKLGIMSPAKILEQSVCEVYNHLTSPDQFEGTLFDPRMGTSSRSKVNALSKQSMMHDPGYFGHINLAKPVIQYQYISQLISTLNMTCNRCSSILIIKKDEDGNDTGLVKKLRNMGNKSRFIMVDLSKEKNCPNCGACAIKYSRDKDGIGRITGKSVSVMTIPTNVKNCDTEAGSGENDDELEEPKKKTKKTQVKKTNDDDEVDLKPKEIKRFVDPEIALNILKNITEEDAQLMGYEKGLSHPASMILTIMPVPPPAMRPAVKTEAGLTADDDLTHKLNDIVKTNNQIRNLLEEDNPDKTKYINHWWQLLQYHVATYVDNEISNVPTATNRSGRAYKTLRQRIKAKEGRIRGNLMGKRVDGSARTVITADPNISIDEVGFPMQILTNLTFPETVTDYNIVELTKLVRNGPKWPGAKCIRYDNISEVEQKLGQCQSFSQKRCVLKYLSQEDRDKIVLKPGDEVQRHLMGGDWVLFNRQPSLHKMSMMGHRIRPMKAGKSFRLNINVTTPYGADFDGDEMNAFIPSSLSTTYELKKLVAVPTQIVSPQASRPVMGLVQDSLLGVYRMTTTERPDYHNLDLMNIMTLMGWTTTYQGTLPHSSSGNQQLQWNGRDLISTYFPKISYLLKDEDNILSIQDGKVKTGFFDKRSFGAKAGSVIHLTWNDYGPETTRHLFDNTMNVAMQWLLIDGFSVGLKDIYIPPTAHQDITEKVNDKITEAKLKIDFLHKGWYPILTKELQTEFNRQLEELVEHKVPEDQERFLDTGKSVAEQFELDIYAVLDRSRGIAEKLTYQWLNTVAEEDGRTNSMESMIGSGSKGSKTNLVQIDSLLGQQGIEGGRAPEEFYRRTLPHFYKDNLTPEARGFIDNSYLHGLTPTQYIFHAMAGRIGVISTSIKTAETGYLQRKLVKVLEDAKVKYDGTVRNSNDMILQYSYGQDGFDGAKIEIQRFDYLDMNNNTFQTTYQYMPDEDLQAMLSIEAYNEMENTENWQQKLNDEFTQINDDRNQLKFNIFKNGIPEKIYAPVNFRRILKNYQFRFEILDRTCADLNPLYVIDRVNALIKEIEIHDKPALHGQDNSIVLIAMIRSYLASKKIIREKYTKEAFEFLIEDIRKQYYGALITPGEMVGAIAAQSIGEPTTQLTLNVFHSTGIGSGANVSRGIPRITELLRVAQTLKTPALEVYIDQTYLKQDSNPDDNSMVDRTHAYNRAEEMAANLEYTVIRDLVEEVEILFDKSDCPSDIVKDQAFIDAYYEFLPDCRPDTSYSPWVLRIQFREDVLYNKGITLLDIEQAIKNNKSRLDSFKTDVSCIFSDDNAEQLICRIRLKTDALNNENPVNIMRLLEKILLDIKVKGIDGIETARVRLIEPVDFKRDDGTIGKTYDWVVDTAGINLIDVLNAPYVDSTKTLSNHMLEVIEVFGVEAARQMIINEIVGVLSYAGAYVNPRHIELLADTMCREGYLISVDRHGVNKSDSGPWAKASFEETTNQLFQAAMYGETDFMTGVSANIMFGQPFPGGTNSFNVQLDESVLETVDIPKQDAVYQGMAAPGQQSSVDEYCDFKEDHFVFQL